MSTEEEIDEMLFNFVSFLMRSVGSSVPDEVLNELIRRFRKIGETLKNQIIQLKNNVGALLKDNEMLRSELQKTKEELDKVKGRLSQIEEVYSTLQGENEKLKREIENIRKEKAALEDEVENLRRELDEAVEKRKEVKLELESVKDEKEALNKELGEIKSRFDEVLKRKEEMEAILEDIETLIRRASSRARDDLVADITKISDQIRNTIYELKTMLKAQARARLEKINAMVNMILSKVRTKDFGSAIIRALKEQSKKQTTQ